jgi:hypothetical protein
MIPPIPVRTLRDYLASLPVGPGAAVVGQNLNIRTDLATMAQAVPNGGTTGQVLTKLSNTDLNVGWTTAGVGDMLKSVYDPQNKNADAFARANQTGTQSYTTITGLGSAALNNTGDFATAAQGALADSAVQPAATQTLTNKRITPRIATTASTATLAPNADTQDATAVTAQAGALSIAAPTGTPTNGQSLLIRIKDNGTIRAVSWNAIYTAFTPTDLRTATIVGKVLIFQFIYNSTDVEWQLLHSNASFGIWS